MDIYKMLFEKQISIEEFAVLTAQEPQDVIERLQEIIDGYDIDFVPSTVMKDVAKTLYDEFKDVAISDKENKYDIESKLAETLRKTISTYDAMKQTKSIITSSELYIQSKPQDEPLTKMIPYLCPKCRQKVLDILDEQLIEE